MSDTSPDINAVISSAAFKAASPETQKALLLKHFPERYGNTTIKQPPGIQLSGDPHKATIGATPTYEKSQPILGGNSLRDLTGILPAALATAGGFGGAIAGGIGAIPGMALGGSTGQLLQSGIDQLVTGRLRPPGPIESATGIADLPPEARSLASAGLEGLEQAGMGKLASVIPSALFQKLIAPNLPVNELARTAESFGLPLSPTLAQKAAAKTLTGSSVAAKGRERGLEKVAAATEKAGKILGASDLPPSADPESIKAYANKAIQQAADADKAALQAAKDAAKLDAVTVNEANAAKHATDVAAAKAEAKRLNTAALAAHKEATRLSGEQARASSQAALEAATSSDEADVGKLLMQVADRTPGQAGNAVKSTVATTSRLGAKEGSRLYQEAHALNSDQIVDLAPHIEELQGLKAAAADSPTLKKYIAKYIPDTPDFDAEAAFTEQYGDILKNRLKEGKPEEYAQMLEQLSKQNAAQNATVPGKTAIPFSEALADLQDLRAKLKIGELSSPRARGLVKKIAGSLEDSITSSIQGGSEVVPAGSPEALKAWQDATDYYSKYSGTFKRGMIPRVFKAMEQTPEDILGFLRDNSPSRIEALREATVGYASRYGTAEEKAAAESAFRSVQGAYVRSKLLKGGLDNLNANLTKAGASLDSMFADNPEFVQALRTVGKATEATKAVGQTKPFVPEIPAPTKISAARPPAPAKVFPRDVSLPPAPDKEAAKEELQTLVQIASRTPKVEGKLGLAVTGATGSLATYLAKLGHPAGLGLAAIQEGLTGLITAASYDPIAARGLQGIFGKVVRGGKISAAGSGELLDAITQVYLEHSKPPGPREKQSEFPQFPNPYPGPIRP